MKTFGNLGSPSISIRQSLPFFFSFFPFASKPPISGNKRSLAGDNPPNFAIVLSFLLFLSLSRSACRLTHSSDKIFAKFRPEKLEGSNYIVDQVEGEAERIDNSFRSKGGEKRIPERQVPRP